jgi:hypothetical protein
VALREQPVALPGQLIGRILLREVAVELPEQEAEVVAAAASVAPATTTDDHEYVFVGSAPQRVVAPATLTALELSSPPAAASDAGSTCEGWSTVRNDDMITPIGGANDSWHIIARDLTEDPTRFANLPLGEQAEVQRYRELALDAKRRQQKYSRRGYTNSFPTSKLDDRILCSACDYCGPGDRADILSTAEATATWVTFPQEASNKEHAGWYMKNCGEPPIRSTASDCSKERDFVARNAFDSLHVRKLIESYLPENKPVAVASSSDWEFWAERLSYCLESKPDLDFMGFKRLTDGKFQTTFKGSNKLFLNHMFEKHHGETISIREDPCGVCEDPDQVTLHHPQFYTENSQTAKRARCDARRFFASSVGADKTASRSLFMDSARHVANKVYRPVAYRGREVEKFNVAFHSLPSLVFQLFKHEQLIDIYVTFCKASLLTASAPHSRGKPSS